MVELLGAAIVIVAVVSVGIALFWGYNAKPKARPSLMQVVPTSISVPSSPLVMQLPLEPVKIEEPPKQVETAVEPVKPVEVFAQNLPLQETVVEKPVEQVQIVSPQPIEVTTSASSESVERPAKKRRSSKQRKPRATKVKKE